jgi:hypothetical protein
MTRGRERRYSVTTSHLPFIEELVLTNAQVELTAQSTSPTHLTSPSSQQIRALCLKWRFGDSKTRIYPGGWVREQVDNDLPASHDIAAAQQHLKKGAIRELHWHRVVR